MVGASATKGGTEQQYRQILAASDAVNSRQYLQRSLSELSYHHHKSRMLVYSGALLNFATTVIIALKLQKN